MGTKTEGASQVSTIQDLENRRDKLAGHVADLQRALDELDGSEELTAVQRMTNDLDAATRLLAALDRQLTQSYAAQREQERAAHEARRQQAAKEAAALRAKMRAATFPLYDLAVELEATVAEFPDLATTASQARAQLLSYMRSVGVELAAGIGTGAYPVR